MNIQTKAMLASLSISQWTARKHDKAVSREVESQHGAHDAGRYNKMLVDKKLLDPITKLAGEIRTYHYSVTLPWNDAGALLPSKLFADYTQHMRGFKAKFHDLVHTLVESYPTEVQAARVRLGTMYDPADYPEPHSMHERFSINLEFMPVPSAADFRVEVTEAAADEIRDDITKSVNARQQQAMCECYRRVKDVVSKIHERLKDEDATFKDSLIENARDLMSVLPGLNITDDPELTALHKEISDVLLVSPQTLRTNPRVRKATADAAEAILASVPWMQ